MRNIHLWIVYGFRVLQADRIGYLSSDYYMRLEHRGHHAILILGVPGSGKTSVARRLADAGFGLHFSASTALGSYASSRESLAVRWQCYWRAGEMAPDEEVLPVLWDRYEVAIKAGPVILDGYPRTLSQFNDFSERGGQINFAFLLETSDSIALARLEQRSRVAGRIDDALETSRERIRLSRLTLSELTRDPKFLSALLILDNTRAKCEETYRAIAEILNRHIIVQPSNDVCG